MVTSQATALRNQWIFIELDQIFLHERSQTVVIDGVNNKPSSVLSGVSQGAVLAPLLFLIFITILCKTYTVLLDYMQMTF